MNLKNLRNSHNITKRYNFEIRANNKTWNVQGNLEHSRMTEAVTIAQNVFSIYGDVRIVDNDTGEILILIAPDD